MSSSLSTIFPVISGFLGLLFLALWPESWGFSYSSLPHSSMTASMPKVKQQEKMGVGSGVKSEMATLLLVQKSV